MKAVVYEAYGPPDVLKLVEVEKPTPKEDELLVQVHASTVTTGDCNMRGFVFVPPGFKTVSRLAFGINKPRKPVLGVEVAGEVMAVGKDVTAFKVGDAIFGLDGSQMGAYAEYKTIKASAGVTTKPESLSYEEAAAIPNGALTALTFLKHMADIQPGQSILIIGASGSIGTAAVQLAKHFGADVTGVCSGRNVDLVQSLGADRVIDYTQTDYTRSGDTYNIVFDTVGKSSFAACRRILKPGGQYLAAAGGIREFGQMLRTSLFGGKKVKAGSSSEAQKDLIIIKQLVEAGALKPHIDRTYPLDQIVEAHRYVDSGHKRGNVAITVADR